MHKLLLIFLFFLTFNIYAQDANEILKKSEEKIKGIKSSYQEMMIKIVRPKWSKEMIMKGWSMGEDYFASVVLSPAKEKGIVFLKRENEVWNYIPSIERTIKLPPSMMMQNWMGTDFTNDDLVQRSSITDDYTNIIIGNEIIDGLDCWLIELIPNEDAAVVWGKLVMWIDKKDYMQLKTQFFDEYDEMVSIMTGKAIKNFDCKIITQINDGFGNALIQGIKEVETDFLCIFNADGSFDPKYLKNMSDELSKNGDFIFNSRYENSGGSDDDTFLTYIGNRLFTFICNLLFRLDISDVLFTYVMGKTLAFKSLELKRKDFRFCIELPVLAKLKKYKLISRPSYERSRLSGKKKVNEFTDGLLILISILTMFIFRK